MQTIFCFLIFSKSLPCLRFLHMKFILDIFVTIMIGGRHLLFTRLSWDSWTSRILSRHIQGHLIKVVILPFRQQITCLSSYWHSVRNWCNFLIEILPHDGLCRSVDRRVMINLIYSLAVFEVFSIVKFFAIIVLFIGRMEQRLTTGYSTRFCVLEGRSNFLDTHCSVLFFVDPTNFSCIIISDIEAIRDLSVRQALLLEQLDHLLSLQIGHYYRGSPFLDSCPCFRHNFRFVL